jgi:hypothetical protein
MAKSHLKLVAPTEVKRTVPPKRQKNAALRTDWNGGEHGRGNSDGQSLRSGG